MQQQAAAQRAVKPQRPLLLSYLPEPALDL